MHNSFSIWIWILFSIQWPWPCCSLQISYTLTASVIDQTALKDRIQFSKCFNGLLHYASSFERKRQTNWPISILYYVPPFWTMSNLFAKFFLILIIIKMVRNRKPLENVNSNRFQWLCGLFKSVVYLFIWVAITAIINKFWIFYSSLRNININFISVEPHFFPPHTASRCCVKTHHKNVWKTLSSRNWKLRLNANILYHRTFDIFLFFVLFYSCARTWEILWII